MSVNCIPITTPIVSALKNDYNHFRIQMAVSEVERPLRNRFRSEMVKRLYITAIPQRKKCSLGCNGYVTAVAAGQSQRFYSGVEIVAIIESKLLQNIALVGEIGVACSPLSSL
jgi:hypothetical protein